MGFVIGLLIIICFIMSARIAYKAFSEQQFVSFETIIIISFLYLAILVAFSMIYLILTKSGYYILLENGHAVTGTYLQQLNTCLYFSAVTLFSVGYGEIIPIGAGRFIAVVEALIGYMLPVVIVAKAVSGIDKVK
ncbi:two pore domain potassium channel family protein [Bacillus lacus]|uniref:Two pore domain potassium channel family protein n=1 Tax=Metabacillus lacus TaxID=1983721 RepID=A0A7X2LYM8_9BACI|nr:ion channel [Metabacillus lacus]MRX73745.1 two pore domain potassium channel family protein [Metabacillus lacus]